jgi:hypothetical protein
MRLVTSAKYLIGLAAASSAVVLLGGSALAAETPVIQYGVQTPSHVTSPGATEEGTSPVATSSEEESQLGSVTEPLEGSTDMVVTTDTEETATTGSAPSQNTLSSTGSGTTQPGLSQIGSSLAVKATKLIEGASITSPKQTLPAEVTTPSSSLVTEITSGKVSEDSAAVLKGQLTNPNRAAAPQVADSVVIGSRVLPIQPRISGHTKVLNVDLAAQLPTAPVGTKIPLPSKSAGLLSSLTLGLAGTVVPQLIALPATFEVVTVVLALSAFMTIFVGFVFSFGLWIRRGGFRSAARSDVASISFATPFFMGYVPAMPHQHNPFLMVAETKIFPVTFLNAMRKEDMV